MKNMFEHFFLFMNKNEKMWRHDVLFYKFELMK